MKVVVRACHSDLDVRHSPHSAVDRRNLLGNHRGVRDENNVGFQPSFVLLYPGRKGRAADLLLALEDKLDIMPEFPCPDKIFKGLYVHE